MSKAADRAYEWVRERIAAGKYPSGFHLREEHIASQAGLSRTPVREALRRLSAEHFVEFVPNRGAYVSTWTKDDVDDILSLRCMLEAYAARRAATRISGTQLNSLENTVASLEKFSPSVAGDAYFAKMAKCNRSFHNAVISAAASAPLNALLAPLVVAPALLLTYERGALQSLAQTIGHYREIIAALEARDQDWAQTAMETHLHAARRACLDQGDYTASKTQADFCQGSTSGT